MGIYESNLGYVFSPVDNRAAGQKRHSPVTHPPLTSLRPKSSIDSLSHLEELVLGRMFRLKSLLELTRPVHQEARTRANLQPPQYKKLALSTLAPHQGKTNPTNSLGLTTFKSRTQQISRHLSSTSTDYSSTMSGHHPNAPGAYQVRKNGQPNTLDYRIFLEKDGVPVSPFHDIPLYANEQQTVLNMVVEIPRWTNAKMEVSCPAG